MVNDCGFPRRYDFKRQFEDAGRCESPIPAAFGLTQAAAMLINSTKLKGPVVRILTSLILVPKRTAEGG
jgi:hypothetical protein